LPLHPWKIVSSKYLVQDRWLSLRADRCETAEGLVIEPYYVQESPDWAHIAAFDEELRLLLVRQYRHGPRSISVELPSGMVDPGEEPRKAVVRELLEETGAEVRELLPLSSMSPNPARMANTVHSFAGTGARIVAAQKLDQAEEIEFFFRPLPTVMEMIDSGEFCHSLHIATLFLALRKLKLLPSE